MFFQANPVNSTPVVTTTTDSRSEASLDGRASVYLSTWRLSLASDLSEWADAPAGDGSHHVEDFAVSQAPPPVVFSSQRLASLLQDEVDQALARLPDADARRLRPRFLRLLEQQLARVGEGLDQAGAMQRLDAELDQMQDEMDALLSAMSPVAAEQPLTAAGHALLAHLHITLMPFGASEAARALLRRAAVALVAAGIDTPERVDALLARAHGHDLRVSMLTSAAGQLGFGVGFMLFSYVLAPLLAPSLMGRGFWPAFGFGFCAGTIVGLTDAVGVTALQNVANAMVHVGDPPLTTNRINGLAAVSTGATFIKNCLSRVVLPTLVMGMVAPEGIQRDNRNTMDLWVDCLGGPPAGALGAWLRATLLDSPQGHALRLLSAADLDALIERVQRPLAAGDIVTALRLLGEGLGKAAVSPSTYAVVFGVVAPMIGLLLAAQNAVPAGTMLLTRAVAGAGEQVIRNGAGTAAAPPVRPDEHALRASISTTLMSLMAGMATAAGGTVGPRIDAPTFRCYVAALRTAMAHLRAPAAEPARGVRLRSVSQV